MHKNTQTCTKNNRNQRKYKKIMKMHENKPKLNVRWNGIVNIIENRG